MLMAARPSEPGSLDLFKLALEVAAHSRAAEPTAVDAYFQSVLRKAKALASGTHSVSGLTPDIIELALALRRLPELATILDKIDSLSDLSPESAVGLRLQMEAPVAG